MEKRVHESEAFLKSVSILLVVRSGGRGLGNLFTAVVNRVFTAVVNRVFTAVVNRVAPSRRRGGDTIHHSREQVSKSPAT